MFYNLRPRPNRYICYTVGPCHTSAHVASWYQDLTSQIITEFHYKVVASSMRSYSMFKISKNIAPLHMSHIMRKPAFCICQSKGADQLRGNHTADQPLFSLHTLHNPSTSKIRNFKLLAIFCDCTDQFVSDP